MNTSHPPRNGGLRPGTLIVLAALVLGLGGFFMSRRPHVPPEAGTPALEVPASGPVRTLAAPDTTSPPAKAVTPPPAVAAVPGEQTAGAVRDSDTGLPVDPDVVNPDNAATPGYMDRLKRHVSLLSALESPARNTAEFRGIANLCERFGYEPWAVAVAYNLAYERHRTERRWTDANGVDTRSKDVVEMTEIGYGHQLEGDLTRHDAPVDPAFVEAMRDFRPKEFLGPTSSPLAQKGDRLVDRMGWPEWRARLEGGPAR